MNAIPTGQYCQGCPSLWIIDIPNKEYEYQCGLWSKTLKAKRVDTGDGMIDVYVKKCKRCLQNS